MRAGSSRADKLFNQKLTIRILSFKVNGVDGEE